MLPGPIQTVLLVSCLCLSAGLGLVLFLKPSLAPIRTVAGLALAATLAQDAVGLWSLALPEGEWAGINMAAELGGAAAWLVFSRIYARPAGQGHAGGWWLVATCLGMGAAAVFPGLFVLKTSAASVLVLTAWGFLLRLAVLVLLIVSLTVLESTLVNSIHGQRWRIKFAILGAFTILTAQVFTVSLGLLYRTLDLSLTPARQTGFILGAALMLYSFTFRGGEKPVTVSKKLARTSVALLGAGAYLIFLGAMGFVMTATGYTGNTALLLAIGLVGGVGALVLMLSDGLRRRYNRVLQTHFYKEKYDYRIQWLSFTKRLAMADTRATLYQAVLLGFSETFGMRGAVLYLFSPDAKRMQPVHSLEITEPAPPIEDWTELSRAVAAGEPAVDLRAIGEGLDQCCLDYFAHVSAAFAVPLKRDEALDGAIILVKSIDPAEQYTEEDFDLMEALAAQAHSAILNHRLLDQLAKARDMEIMGKVSAFIVHDLKNLVYALSLIVDNAKRYIANPEFQVDMLAGLENTVSKMHKLISQLRRMPGRENLELERADLSQLAREAFRHSPETGLEFRGDAAVAMVDRQQLQKVVVNLALNALESGEQGMPVVIETGADPAPYLKVIDSGCGMSPEFIRESLFQPFKTTKAKGIGIGLYQCKQIVEAHGGTIEVESMEGSGSVFTVRLLPSGVPNSAENA